MTLRISGLTLCGAAMLAACTPAQTQQAASIEATISTDIPKAQAALAQAVSFAGVAGGIAIQAASVIDPSAAPALQAEVTKGAALLATAQSVASAGLQDATVLNGLASAITAQSVAITVAAAPAVKVIPSASAGS